MPIAQYKPNQVALRPVASNAQSGPDAAAFGGQIGTALQGAAKAIGGVNDFVQQVADMNAETHVRETDIKLAARIREEMRGEQGLWNHQGTAFVDNAKSYEKRIADYAEELQGTGRNALEQRMLTDTLSRRVESARNEIQGETLRQAQFAHKSAAAASAVNAVADVSMLRPTDEGWRDAVARLEASATDEAVVAGLGDPASLEANRRQRWNEASVNVASRYVLDKDFAGASQFLQTQMLTGKIEPKSAFSLMEHVNQLAEENTLGSLVEGVTPENPALTQPLTAVTPALSAAISWQESRNRPGVGGPVLRDGTQAWGSHQVLDTTGAATAKKLGVAWQPALMRGTTPEAVRYQKQIGDAYMGELLQQFDGNQVLAIAAYNAGPGRLTGWTDKQGVKHEGWLKTIGDPRKGQVSAAEFAARIPFSETKDYVAQVVSKLGGSIYTPLPKNTMDTAQVETWVQQFPVDQRAKARSGAMAVVSRNRSVRQQRWEAAWDQAQPYLLQDQPWTAIPVGIRTSLSPEHQTALQKLQTAGTNRATSPEAMDLFYSKLESDPTWLADKSTDLLPLAADFSKEDFEQLRKMQHQARTGTGEWKAPAAQYATLTRNAADVVPTALLKPARKQELAKFKAQWWRAVQTAQSGKTEPLTDDEVVSIGTRLTSEVAINGGVLGAKTRPLYGFDVNDKNEAIGLTDIPAAERNRVRLFLMQRTPGKTVTNGQVLETWRTLKATGGI